MAHRRENPDRLEGPSRLDRALTHQIIYEELCKEIVTSASRAAFEQIAARLVARGADSLILGCTEIGMLLDGSNVACPVFDTTNVHCDAAITLALSTPRPTSGDDAKRQLLELGGSVSAEYVGGADKDMPPVYLVTAQVGEQRLMVRLRGTEASVEQQAASKLLESVFSGTY